jgi:hypothetical protein
MAELTQEQWRELAEQRGRELDAERARVSKARIAERAAAFGFHDPADVVGRVDPDAEGLLLDEALSAIAERSPHLVGAKPPAELPGGGLTVDEIYLMTPAQREERWEDVAEVMAAQGGTTGRPVYNHRLATRELGRSIKRAEEEQI